MCDALARVETALSLDSCSEFIACTHIHTYTHAHTRFYLFIFFFFIMIKLMRTDAYRHTNICV